jgi:hypothetical protein
LGKYFGTLGTVIAFIALDAAAVLGVLALETGQTPWKLGVALGALSAVLIVALVRAKYTRVFVFLPWALAALVAMASLASTAGLERQLVLASAALTLAEVVIVAAVATFFASFSSPFLTAIFTVGVFLVGRSADTLANLPQRLLGEAIRTGGRGLARIAPNLHVYVPARPLLLGEIASQPVWTYVGLASVQAGAYAMALLVLSALIFRKRDFP